MTKKESENETWGGAFHQAFLSDWNLLSANQMLSVAYKICQWKTLTIDEIPPWHALNSTFPDTNCIVSFQINPHWISNWGFWKVVLEIFQNCLENCRRESCFTRTMILHTSLWLQWLLCVTCISLNKKQWICSLFKEWIWEKSEIRVNLEWTFVLFTHFGVTTGITQGFRVIPEVTPKWVNNTNVHSKFTPNSL